MVDIQNFWRSNHHNNPPLTENMIKHAERVLEVRLPQTYLDLLRIQNGGYLFGFVLPTSEPTRMAADHIFIEELAGIILEPPSRMSQNILASSVISDDWGLPEKQVLLCGEGHWWVTLDYRNSDVPSVWLIDVEWEYELQLAPTFDEFLDGLIPEADFDFGDS